MKKSAQILFISLPILFFSCEDIENKQASKDQLITKLEKLETDLTDQISAMEKESREIGEKAKKDVASAILQLKNERRKIQRLAKKTSKSSEKEIKEMNENLESLQKELNTFSDKLQKEVQSLKQKK